MKKRICDGCKAFLYSEFSGRCELGYTIEKACHCVVFGRDIFSYAPIQKCPKPRTNKQYLEILKEKLSKE